MSVLAACDYNYTVAETHKMVCDVVGAKSVVETLARKPSWT